MTRTRPANANPLSLVFLCMQRACAASKRGANAAYYKRLFIAEPYYVLLSFSTGLITFLTTSFPWSTPRLRGVTARCGLARPT